ncbi:MAG TPA: hypothetical protein VHR47_06240, partial [Bacillota bacterium]|nr:hypothetical protein [Bacillota bacterium]
GTLHTLKSLGVQRCLIAIIVLEIIQLWERSGSIRQKLAMKPLIIRWAFYYAVIFGIVFFSVGAKEQFIYFQF